MDHEKKNNSLKTQKAQNDEGAYKLMANTRIRKVQGKMV